MSPAPDRPAHAPPPDAGALQRRIEASLPDVTPGVVLRALHRGRTVLDLRAGQTWPAYDLASLTKIVFTQQAMMQAFEAGLWRMDTCVDQVLPDYPHRGVPLASLLTHTSGITWWEPFYERIDRTLPWPGRREWLYAQLCRAPLQPDGKAVYSDLGFMLLGFVLERLHARPLLAIWQALQASTYPGTGFAFHPDNRAPMPSGHYAPTELCAWRGQRLQGQVHDDNTWALGGVSTHAGLFGGIDDLCAYGLVLRAQHQGRGGPAVGPACAARFMARAVPRACGDWALGLMLPSAEGASCGRHFSARSIGHTGFTGTSLWFDPDRDLLVAMLSNRVYLGRENRAFLALRPRIHDWVVEAIDPQAAQDAAATAPAGAAHGR